MIAFSSTNILSGDGIDNGDGAYCLEGNYLVSVKSGGGYCISKLLVTSIFEPRQLTIIIMFNRHRDIVAVPELYSSAFVPWQSARPVYETAQAFLNGGVCEEFACCVATAVGLIYEVLHRNQVEYYPTEKNYFSSSMDNGVPF